ncbi:PQQ-binding-like beta-propeller repeat protein [Kitasatospora sp. NPDC101183]|uniref:outer membrane protein assembly factor BamB family protein n=1 Tax=Kitasatospora sp. NPDC101183 TaxID=3364100 RepID=UPI0038083CFF
MRSPSSEGRERDAAWEWEGGDGGGPAAPGEVVSGDAAPRRRVLLAGAGALAAAGAAWALGRSGDGAGPAPRPRPTALSGPTPLWTYRGPEAMTPERLVRPPGRPLYVSETGLQVLDPASGEPARLLPFERPDPRWPSDADRLGKVVLGPEHLYSSASVGHLDARHLTDPTADWSLPLPPEVIGPDAPPFDRPGLSACENGVLYGFDWGRYRGEDATPDNLVFALRLADRSLLWSVHGSQGEQPVTTTASGTRVVCVRTLGNRAALVLRDAATGRELFTAPGAEDLRWCAAGPQHVFVPDGNGGVQALRPTGEPLWTHSPARGESWRSLPPLADGAQVYVPRDDGLVTGHDAATGKVRWTARLPFLLDRRSRPVVVGSTLFVPGTATGGVSAVNTAGGRLLWTFRDSGPGRDVWSLAADAERLYAGHDDVLHALPLA